MRTRSAWVWMRRGSNNYTRGSPINLIDPGGMTDAEPVPSGLSDFFNKDQRAELAESVRARRAAPDDALERSKADAPRSPRPRFDV